MFLCLQTELVSVLINPTWPGDTKILWHDVLPSLTRLRPKQRRQRFHFDNVALHFHRLLVPRRDGWRSWVRYSFKLPWIKRAHNWPTSKTCARGVFVGTSRSTRWRCAASGSHSTFQGRDWSKLFYTRWRSAPWEECENETQGGRGAAATQRKAHILRFSLHEHTQHQIFRVDLSRKSTRQWKRGCAGQYR